MSDEHTTLRCRPGDLAIVVGATLPTNQGRIVRVLGPYLSEPPLIWPSRRGHAWLCECAQPMLWIVNGVHYPGRRGPIGDKDLKPIRPPGPDVDVPRNAPVEAVETN